MLRRRFIFIITSIVKDWSRIGFRGFSEIGPWHTTVAFDVCVLIGPWCHCISQWHHCIQLNHWIWIASTLRIKTGAKSILHCGLAGDKIWSYSTMHLIKQSALTQWYLRKGLWSNDHSPYRGDVMYPSGQPQVMRSTSRAQFHRAAQHLGLTGVSPWNDVKRNRAHRARFIRKERQ